ncbi:hypothetical protein [Psychrobacter aquimaris]|uniref:hypothetical protein n=1 Tax=Psychrobacter aquimaris TaxID=292733 RepID=UPI0018DFEA5A|nr:hypothetical protein [Psychrobacter aquimaris]
MIVDTVIIGAIKSGYIAGSADGIVTVAGQPAKRDIYLLNANDLSVAHTTESLRNGHYMFLGLDPNKEYLVMARDYKKEFEPFVWDYVKPADDLTISEQQALWASWQTI